MRKLIHFVFLFILSQLHAQAPTEKTLLWKISGNGAKTSYLFGTMHATCDATLTTAVSEALDNTQQLYLELDMDDPSLQMEMVKGLNMANGQKMTDLVSAEDFATVEDFLKKNMGMSLKTMNNMKPFFVSSLLITKLLDCPMQSLEQSLMKTATANNKQVLGLETVTEQTAVFDAIPYKVQMEELVKTAKNDMKNDRKEFQDLYALYQKQDLAGMLDLSKASDNKLTSEFENELLVHRNANWIPRISKIISEKPTFFGVGAAHLGGESGVIALLRKKGFKVEPVANN